MKKNTYKRPVAALVILLLGNLLFFLTLWLLSKYDQVYLDQMVFQLKTSSEGVHKDLASSAAVRVGLFGIVATAVEVFAGRVCKFFRKRALALALAMLVCSVTLFGAQLDVLAYVENISTESDFIEDNYVDPKQAKLHFPKEKRNLIYIFLESMENTFSDTKAGTPITADYIPELTMLAQKNVSFSNTEGMGGALSFSGTTWTAAAMAAQTCGVPVKMEMAADEDAYGAGDDFLPGAVSIGEILEKQGYNQTLLVGSDAKFHGREAYFTQHGNYEIVDINSLKEEGRLPQDYMVWWGFEDEKLFTFAKEELTRLAGEKEPFNFTMLTVDTHFPDGYRCLRCGNTYEEQYANVLYCSSKQVYEFVKWIQKQPFYENTTIVISGDHLTMDAAFLDEMDENYVRTVYNCIINAPVTPAREKNRQFATFDMFPTTLAALGVEIEGDRLGLGTNLFSNRETLTEKYGYDALDEELQKKSEFYNKKILEMEE
ncbi:MAG: LTA synthase family protein [Lachnospiraceae bacterium]|nr:LTA synthase family protein [Lachnospiraceae bacterium]